MPDHSENGRKEGANENKKNSPEAENDGLLLKIKFEEARQGGER
jgi:hypothetical protein